MEEMVDILMPPMFEKSGIVKSKDEAYNSGDWIGTFNLWIVKGKPVPSIIYQQRSFNASWAPGKLDVAVGGHYQAGEEGVDGLREAKEEIGKDYDKSKLISIGKKLTSTFDKRGRKKNNVISLYLIEDNSPLESYKVDEKELEAVCVCPIDELIKVNSEKGYSFEADGISANGEKIKIRVDKNSFPENYDNYHFKMALLVDRYFKGEKNLIY
jgi:hypothetical protein